MARIVDAAWPEIASRHIVTLRREAMRSGDSAPGGETRSARARTSHGIPSRRHRFSTDHEPRHRSCPSFPLIHVGKQSIANKLNLHYIWKPPDRRPQCHGYSRGDEITQRKPSGSRSLKTRARHTHGWWGVELGSRWSRSRREAGNVPRTGSGPSSDPPHHLPPRRSSRVARQAHGVYGRRAPLAVAPDTATSRPPGAPLPGPLRRVLD